MRRRAEIHRKTGETEIRAGLVVDGRGESRITTPIGFLTHMLETFSRHGLFDLELEAAGDIHVGQHHLVEDTGLVLGLLFDRALGSRKGIGRTGYFVFPMDEALAVVAVDIAGRPCLQFDLRTKRRFCGGFDTDVLEDFFQGFASSLRANLAVRMPFGRSDHHKIEAAFKAFGRAMRAACAVEARLAGAVPSTKGVIDHDRDR